MLSRAGFEITWPVGARLRPMENADMKKWMAIGLALLLVVAGVWFWGFRDKGGEIRILATAKVERGEVRKVLEATGIVKPQVGAQIQIGSRVTGILAKVPVRVGDVVRKGDLVAVIDARELKAKLAQAEAQRRLSQARYDYAKKDLERKKVLVGKKLEAQSVLDEAVQAAGVARYEVEANQAAIDTLKVQLSYTEVYSTIDGVVSQVTSQEGETVVAGMQVANLVTVLDPTLLEMWIYVDESDVGRAAPGLPVEFTVDAHPGTVFHGSIDRIYPEPEIKDNIVYYRALVQVERADAGRLRPEMTTQCKIIVEVKKGVLFVPNAAIKWVDGRQAVFVKDADGKAREAKVELGLAGPDRTEVLAGLDEGQEVAVQVVLPGQKKQQKGG